MSKLQTEFFPENRTRIQFSPGIIIDVPSEQTEIIEELRRQAA